MIYLQNVGILDLKTMALNLRYVVVVAVAVAVVIAVVVVVLVVAIVVAVVIAVVVVAVAVAVVAIAVDDMQLDLKRVASPDNVVTLGVVSMIVESVVVDSAALWVVLNLVVELMFL